MYLIFSFFPVRVRVLVLGEGRIKSLTPVGVRVPVPGEGRTWTLPPVRVRVPDEGHMVAHVRSCSSSQ